VSHGGDFLWAVVLMVVTRVSDADRPVEYFGDQVSFGRYEEVIAEADVAIAPRGGVQLPRQRADVLWHHGRGVFSRHLHRSRLLPASQAHGQRQVPGPNDRSGGPTHSSARQGETISSTFGTVALTVRA
jgi:hypothetical protein